MIISTLTLIFGLLFALRIYIFNEQNRIFDNQILKNSLIIIVFLTLLCCSILFERYFFAWIAVVGAIFSFAVTIFVTAHVRERKFRQDFVDFMDRLILQVRSGHSFRNSLEVSNTKTPEPSRFKVEKIIEAVYFSQKIETSNAFVREIFEELSSVQRCPHKTLDRLCAFRRKMKIEDDFRRRSGRIVRQVRIQIIFLLFMYLAVMSFVMMRFGFIENLKIILWSLALFTMGLVGFFYLGVKKQWKI
jgi:Flp pilus assembly protein TadB